MSDAMKQLLLGVVLQETLEKLAMKAEEHPSSTASLLNTLGPSLRECGVDLESIYLSVSVGFCRLAREAKHGSSEHDIYMMQAQKYARLGGYEQPLKE